MKQLATKCIYVRLMSTKRFSNHWKAYTREDRKSFRVSPDYYPERGNDVAANLLKQHYGITKELTRICLAPGGVDSYLYIVIPDKEEGADA